MHNITASNIIWTLLLIVVGLLLVVFSDTETVWFGFDISTVLSTLGTFFILSSIVGFYFENFSKKKFFNEIFDRISSSSSFRDAGLVELFMNSKDINYGLDIENSESITTLFTYSDGFLKRYKEEIERAIGRGSEINFLFLNRNSNIIKDMISLGWQEKSILANYETIEKFAETHKDSPNVQVKFFDALPRYSAVCFDKGIYIIEQTTSTGRRNVPALKLDSHGTLAEFYIADINRIQK